MTRITREPHRGVRSSLMGHLAGELGTHGLSIDQDGWAMLDVYPGGKRCAARFRAIGHGDEAMAWREGPPVVPVSHGNIVHAALPPGFPDNQIQVRVIDQLHQVWLEREYVRVKGVAVLEDSFELRTMAFPYCDLPLVRDAFHERLPQLPRDARRGWVALLVEYALYEGIVSLDDAEALFPPARRCVRRADCGPFIDLALTRPPPDPWAHLPDPWRGAAPVTEPAPGSEP